MRIKELVQIIINQLQKTNISSARLDGELIVAKVTGQNRAWLLSHDEDEVTNDVKARALKLAQERAKRLPLSYVLGEKEFYGLDFVVDNNVLTPRAESEIIVAQAIQTTPSKGHVLDLGTGSGVLAIALSFHRPDLDICATDISEDALKIARLNANNILQTDKPKISFIKSDLFDEIKGRYDTIMANLPYVPSDNHHGLLPEVKHEPAVALFGGHDGLKIYQRFFHQINQYIKPSGQIFIEADPWQHLALIKLAKSAKLKIIFEDYFVIGFAQENFKD